MEYAVFSQSGEASPVTVTAPALSPDCLSTSFYVFHQVTGLKVSSQKNPTTEFTDNLSFTNTH